MTSPRNLKTIAGCPTRILVSITAPEDTDTELTGYVNSAGNALAAAVQGTAEEGEILFPPLPAGEHMYEIRCAGKPIAWGHLLARQTAYPLQPSDVVDWELAADLTATDAVQISLQLLPGARGLTGESAYDAAVQGGYEGTEEEFAAMLAGLPQAAANAAESAQDAAASRAAAAASETAAAASATDANNSATTAAGSATTASTKATEAANSATTAANKATEAANSATAAAGSATEAGISAASAGASAQDAADDAADASTAAATATAQAALATTQAGNAAASATTASEKATAAGNSATAAAGSATTASNAATEAAGSATTAGQQASAAAQSATAAADAAEDAAESAELLGDAALQGRNNTFTQTNTFNGAVALNGTTTKPASAEVWSADSIMTLGMHQVAAWWDELQADNLFNPVKTELDSNALMVLEGTTDAVQTIGPDGGVSGKGLTANTGLTGSDLVAGRITLNPRAQVKIFAAGTWEDVGGDTAFDSTAHEWLWVTWYKKDKRVRDINLIGAYAAANSCPVVLVCDSAVGDSLVFRPVTTKIVDAYLGSAPARGAAAGNADTVFMALVGLKSGGGSDIYIGFKGGGKREKRLIRHYTLPQFGFGQMGSISSTSYLPSVTAARGNLAASGDVTHKMDMWAYQGTYQPTDPAGSAAFFVKDAQKGMGEGYQNTKYDAVQAQAMNVYLADVQDTQPSTSPQDYTYSSTPHDNKDDVSVPAAGGYVLAKIVWYMGTGRYYGSYAIAQAVVMDSWLVDTNAGADEDGWVLGTSHSAQWILSKKETGTFDQWGGTATCYAYIKVPANTTGAERDGYAVIGITGMRASLVHIVQAAN